MNHYHKAASEFMARIVGLRAAPIVARRQDGAVRLSTVSSVPAGRTR